jgi:hypothetical protein
MVDVQSIRSVLDFDPETGVFTWKKTMTGTAKNGDIAGNMCRGRRRIKVFGKTFIASRLAWLMVNGSLPVGEIDHVNCDSTDDRFCNLRIADRKLNSANRRVFKNNSSGKKGVSWDAKNQKWRAGIKVNGKSFNLGRYASKEAAAAAYEHAAISAFGEYARAS